MAFKGGTSLSKVYNAIHRFSEDVDISFDYRDLLGEAWAKKDPVKMSGEALKKLRENLRGETERLVVDTVIPKLKEAVEQDMGETAAAPEVDDSGEKVKVFYPSIADREGYLREWVLLEFGGRNLTEPCSSYIITPEIAAHLPDLDFPAASVTVLAPERTFWEKATLIHAECSRGTLRPTADRPSRHLYDLALLADHDIGRRALNNLDLFASVVEHKAWAFKDKSAHYERCLNGGLLLVPEAEAMREALQKDFDAMNRARLFTTEPPTFSQIEARLATLADEINATAGF